MSFLDQITSSIASGVSGAIGGLPSAGINSMLNLVGMNQQKSVSKELMDYQWNKFMSPKAQVNALAAAGINPAVALGQGGTGQFASPSVSMPSSVPVQVDNVSDMLSSLTQLKKVDKENELVDQEIYKTLSEKGLLDEQRHGQAIANVIAMEYGDKKAAAEIANLGAQAALAASQKDLNEAEKDLTDLKAKTEKVYKDLVEQNKYKAALEVKNYQRYINSVIDSNLKQAKLAESQSSKAESETKYQNIVNDIKESGKSFELENLIKDWHAKNKLNDYQYQQALFWYRRMSKLNKQLSGNDLKSKIERELDDFFWYWKDEVPSIDLPSFLITLPK